MDNPHRIIVHLQTPSGNHITKQIALTHGYHGDTDQPKIHLEFSRETTAFLIRFLQHQLDEDRFTPGFSSCFVVVDDDTTPEMQEFLDSQKRKTEADAYIRSCVKYPY